MNSIISVLIVYNQFLLSQIQKLLLFIVKNIPIKSPKWDFTSPKYNRFTVDQLPVIKKFDKLDYKQLLKEYKAIYGKDKKPVKSRGKNPVPENCICPRLIN